MNWCASAARSIDTCPPSRRVCSIITTASAPDGNGRAGHDLDGLPRGELSGEALAGAHFADDLELSGQIDGAHRVAVADGSRHRGRIAVRGDILREHASGGIGKGNLLDGGLGAPLAHGAENGFASIRKCQRRHASIIALRGSGAGRAAHVEKGQPFPAALFRPRSFPDTNSGLRRDAGVVRSAAVPAGRAAVRADGRARGIAGRAWSWRRDVGPSRRPAVVPW